MFDEINQSVLLEQFFGKKKWRVWFSDSAKIDAKSEEGGVHSSGNLSGMYKRPYFVDVLMFNAKDPDGKDTVSREATQEDIERYQKEFELYTQTKNIISIEKLPKITQSALELLRYIGVNSIQQFDALSDDDIYEELKWLKPIARNYLNFINGVKPRVKLEAVA